MSGKGILTIFAIVGVIHMIMAFLSTIDLKDNPLFSLSKKCLWFLVVWCIPVFGALLFHYKTGLGWSSGHTTGGEGTTGGVSGGDCGGGGGGEGGC